MWPPRTRTLVKFLAAPKFHEQFDAASGQLTLRALGSPIGWCFRPRRTWRSSSLTEFPTGGAAEHASLAGLAASLWRLESNAAVAKQRPFLPRCRPQRFRRASRAGSRLRYIALIGCPPPDCGRSRSRGEVPEVYDRLQARQLRAIPQGGSVVGGRLGSGLRT